jgi:hypothetical protein
VANTIALALDHHGISSELSHGLSVANAIFASLFAVEMAVKIGGNRHAALKRPAPLQPNP